MGWRKVRQWAETRLRKELEDQRRWVRVQAEIKKARSIESLRRLEIAPERERDGWLSGDGGVWRGGFSLIGGDVEKTNASVGGFGTMTSGMLTTTMVGHFATHGFVELN
ncbi:hypothetical protein BJY52DRAFT_1223729 [Lactarius psammicola]|nr:hypothetical protein BJY52DRAFT_1223729 [Lactarius psammicola]